MEFRGFSPEGKKKLAEAFGHFVRMRLAGVPISPEEEQAQVFRSWLRCWDQGCKRNPVGACVLCGNQAET